ncbi:MAG: biopolymer transporter ExbD [Myxococcales bacterium]|nr:biopolymer transporter ExbD [Myxococcales bacterium]
MARSEEIGKSEELNLAPIMNMVMILIPFMLINASFVLVAALEVHSPQNSAQSVNPEQNDEQEEVQVPRVLVGITEDGFTVSDLRSTPEFLTGLNGGSFGAPIEGCQSGPASNELGQNQPVTVCNRNSGNGSLLTRLNYRGLYNRLVEIHEHPAWADRWETSNEIVNIVADREIPVEVVIRTMDVARYYLEANAYSDEEQFQTATYNMNDGQPRRLFPDPVLLLPRPSAE